MRRASRINLLYRLYMKWNKGVWCLWLQAIGYGYCFPSGKSCACLLTYEYYKRNSSWRHSILHNCRLRQKRLALMHLVPLYTDAAVLHSGIVCKPSYRNEMNCLSSTPWIVMCLEFTFGSQHFSINLMFAGSMHLGTCTNAAKTFACLAGNKFYLLGYTCCFLYKQNKFC